MVKFSDLEKSNLESNKSPKKEIGERNRRSALSFRDLEKEPHRITPSQGTPPKEVGEKERREIYDTVADYLTGVLDAVRKRQRFALESGQEIIRRMISPPSSVDPLLIRAIYQDNPHGFLVNHCVNVTVFAIKMAAELGLGKLEQEQIGLAALLHEVGMGVIPEKLIYKEQKLDEQEYAIFKKRPEFAYKILVGFGDDYAYLAETALQVHECMDGSGYPAGLSGDEIHLYAQIIGLVDMYEALTHSRPQRDKLLHFSAVKQVIKTGKRRYPKKHLKALLNIFSIFPLYSFVKLNSNAVGRVIQTYPEQPMRPRIEVVFDSQGRRALTQHVINLSENSILYVVDSVSEKDITGLVEGPGTKRFSRAPASIHNDPESAIIQDVEDVDSEVPPGDDILKITEEDFMPSPPERENDESEPGRSSFTMRSKEAQGSTDGLIDENLVQFPTMEKGRWIRRYKWAMPVFGILILAGVLLWQQGILDFSSKNTEERGMAVKPSEKKVSAGPQQKAKDQSAVSTVPTNKGESPTTPVSSKKEKKAAKTDNKQVLKEKTQSAPAPLKVPAASSKQAPSRPPPVSAAISSGGVAINLPATQPGSDKTLTDVSAGIKPAGGTADDLKGGWGSNPFSIKLDSFRTLKEAQAAVPAYRAKGLNAYWVKANLGSQGIWYRVFAGFYSTLQQAEAVIRELGLKVAVVKETKYATRIGAFSSQDAIDQKIKLLSEKGYSSYVIQDSAQKFYLLVGAFYTRKGAAEQVADLLSKGIQGQIVER